MSSRECLSVSQADLDDAISVPGSLLGVHSDPRTWFKLTLTPSTRRLPMSTSTVEVEYIVQDVDVDMVESNWGEGRVVRMVV